MHMLISAAALVLTPRGYVAENTAAKIEESHYTVLCNKQFIDIVPFLYFHVSIIFSEKEAVQVGSEKNEITL